MGQNSEIYPMAATESTGKKQDPEALLQAVMYEYYTTLAQESFEDYLTHPEYTGWIHQQKILAVPFFNYDRTKSIISRNHFSAPYLGIGGSISNYYNSYPYRVLLTWLNSKGSFELPVEEQQFFAYYTSRLYDQVFQLDLQIGAEFSSLRSPNYAAGISLTWQLDEP